MDSKIEQLELFPNFTYKSKNDFIISSRYYDLYRTLRSAEWRKPFTKKETENE